MSSYDDMKHGRESQSYWLSWRVGLVLAGFIVVAGFLLFTEHRAHVLGALIYLPLLLCPLMHFFMHSRHGHGSHERPDRERREL